MAKRPTIGENPLDTVVQEAHLDTVVPPAGPQAGRPKEEAALETQKRLTELEAEIKSLKKEISLLRLEMIEMQERMSPLESKWMVRLREKLVGR